MAKWAKKYKGQKRGASKRGIGWGFTYITWLKVWKKSGHLHERGRGTKEYVMSRPGDIGPYSPENVRIVLAGENSREAHLGKIRNPMGRKYRSPREHPRTAPKGVAPITNSNYRGWGCAPPSSY